jgi:hypothetical protein
VHFLRFPLLRRAPTLKLWRKRKRQREGEREFREKQISASPMKTLFTLLIALITFDVYAQITPSDSSIQVVGYWRKNEKQSYQVTNTSYKLIDGDTSSLEVLTYEGDITVIDSTAKSYTIEWKYKNTDASRTNKYMQSLTSLMNGTRVIIKTDEFGRFEEVVNWKEVGDDIRKAMDKLRKDHKGDMPASQTKRSTKKFITTKASIESQSINEILQFYAFHGNVFKLNEERRNQLVSNAMPGYPVEYEELIVATNVNVQHGISLIRMWKRYDPSQATDRAYEMNRQMALATGTTKDLPKRENMPDMHYTELTFSHVHIPTGWIIKSALLKHTVTGSETEVHKWEIVPLRTDFTKRMLK